MHDAAIAGDLVPVVLALELARNGVQHRLRRHGVAGVADAPGAIEVVDVAVVGDVGARVGNGSLSLARARGIGVSTVGLARECEIAISVGQLVIRFATYRQRGSIRNPAARLVYVRHRGQILALDRPTLRTCYAVLECPICAACSRERRRPTDAVCVHAVAAGAGVGDAAAVLQLRVRRLCRGGVGGRAATRYQLAALCRRSKATIRTTLQVDGR